MTLSVPDSAAAFHDVVVAIQIGWWKRDLLPASHQHQISAKFRLQPVNRVRGQASFSEDLPGAHVLVGSIAVGQLYDLISQLSLQVFLHLVRHAAVATGFVRRRNRLQLHVLRDGVHDSFHDSAGAGKDSPYDVVIDMRRCL